MITIMETRIARLYPEGDDNQVRGALKRWDDMETVPAEMVDGGYRLLEYGIMGPKYNLNPGTGELYPVYPYVKHGDDFIPSMRYKAASFRAVLALGPQGRVLLVQQITPEYSKS